MMPPVEKPAEAGGLWQQLTMPLQLSPLWLLLVFLAGLGLALLLASTAINDRYALHRDLVDERARTASLLRDGELLQMQLDAAEQSLTLLREDLGESRRELLALERDNTFYKGLVSPEELQSGIKLHRFALQSIVEPAAQGAVGTEAKTGAKAGEGESNAYKWYRYEAIVAHVGGRGQKLSGQLRLSLKPKQPAFVRELPLDETSDDASDAQQLLVIEEEIKHKLGFRFFQRVVGKIKLPATFEPATIELKGESKAASFEASYGWQDVLARSVGQAPLAESEPELREQ